jgi:succinyl-CoA---D-citramalate CoA-transferase
MTDQKNSKGPLCDLTVLELGVLIAGPFCGQLLGDFGAEIIKIEEPTLGDPMRNWGQVRPEGASVHWAIISRNKKSMTLNLRTEEGQFILKELVKDADIVLENFKPGTMEKWGLGYDILSSINPGIIMTRVSGYGQTGPYASKAGYASVGEAMGGVRYVVGEPDRLPSRAGISLGDSLAGTFATLGTLMAVHARRSTGRGQVVDASIFESVFALMESLVPEYQFENHIRERTGSFLPGVAPSNIYKCNDGLIIIAANQDPIFSRLTAAMGEPDLAQDKRYLSHVARGQNQVELDERISQWTKKQSVAEVQAKCDEHSVACSQIYRAPEILEDDHYKAREAIITRLHPILGDFKMQNTFPRLSDTPGDVASLAPGHGEHTDEILSSKLGKTDNEIATLRNAGTI